MKRGKSGRAGPCMYVCVCERERGLREKVCMWWCVQERERGIELCVCVCVIHFFHAQDCMSEHVAIYHSLKVA